MNGDLPTGAFNTAKHNGTSIIMAPNKKYSVLGIGQTLNNMLRCVAKGNKQRFDQYNNLLNNRFDYDEMKEFFDSYADGLFDGDIAQTLKYLDSGFDSPLYNVVKQDVEKHVPLSTFKKEHSTLFSPKTNNEPYDLTASAYVHSDAEDKDEDRDYNQFIAALTGTHDSLAHHYGKNNIGLYQVEYDPDDQFTGKDYLENKETAQVDYPAEGKVKVNKVYPGVRIDYDALARGRDNVVNVTKNAKDRNEAFRGLIKPILLADPSEIASDTRLKIIKAHNDWCNTQRAIPNVQRGML